MRVFLSIYIRYILIIALIMGSGWLNSINATEEAPLRKVSGIVIDEDGLPIPGATVFAPISTKGITTSVDGTFSLSLRNDEKKIIVSFIGMKKSEVSLLSDKDYYEITLLEDVKALDEVIVTGYQTISKERTTGSFTIVDKKEIQKKMDPSILQRLEGSIAGLSGRGYDNMTIRGIATLMGNSKPLLVVDGMPLEGDLSTINPATIKNITILKDAAAASIYGARAANGVIVISTVNGNDSNHFGVSYDGSVIFTSRPSFEHLHRMTSRELVDLSIDISDQMIPTTTWNSLETWPERYPYPIELYTKHNEGLLSDSEYEAELERLRTTENLEQIQKELLRVGILNVHNLTLMKSGDKNSFVATLNYRGDRPTNLMQKSDEVGFTLRNGTKFSDRLTSDISIAGNYGFDFANTGSIDAQSMLSQYPSYIRLVNETGSYLPLPNIRSDYSLNQLLEKGLEDETYSPLRDADQEWRQSKSNYTRINTQLTYKVLPELTITGAFQVENGSSYSKDFMSPTSYTVRKMRNDATIEEDGAYVSLIPKGGQMQESRSGWLGYTGRLQLNYDTTINAKHRLTALGGTEIRRIHSTSTRSYLMGYDDTSLGSVPYDAYRLSNLSGTQSLSGRFNFNNSSYNNVSDNDERFVSFYTNFAYEYLGKYNLTGSIRIDQSNLFGVDPKVQYRPLWSLGGSWLAHQESFIQSTSWLDRLILRLTYGIGGNIPKVGGPYMIVKTGEFNNMANVTGSTIVSPPNRSLTWERTATTNFGIDFSILQNRIKGSIDLYNRHTTNLLGYRQAVPTIGWSSLLMNYGSMLNQGVELSLNTINVKSGDFRWTTDFTYSYNHNRLLDIDESIVSVESYLNNGVMTSGKPANSLYSLRWAGLYDTDEEGNRIELGIPHIYVGNEGGTPRVATQTQNMDDLQWEGTMTPIWSGGLTNTFEYRGLSLSFTLVYYGGHKLRDVMAPYVYNYDFLMSGINVDGSIMNAWKKPGDELNPNTTPKVSENQLMPEIERSWYGADIHVIPGDYLRLRNLVLAYSLPDTIKQLLKVSDCTIRFQADNLFYLARNNRDLDPEAYSFGLSGKPLRRITEPKTFTLGLSLSF